MEQIQLIRVSSLERTMQIRSLIELTKKKKREVVWEDSSSVKMLAEPAKGPESLKLT